MKHSKLSKEQVVEQWKTAFDRLEAAIGDEHVKLNATMVTCIVDVLMEMAALNGAHHRASRILGHMAHDILGAGLASAEDIAPLAAHYGLGFSATPLAPGEPGKIDLIDVEVGEDGPN